MPELTEPLCWRFDGLLLDPQAGTLLPGASGRATAPVPVGSRAFQLLCLLVEHRGELVSQREISGCGLAQYDRGAEQPERPSGSSAPRPRGPRRAGQLRSERSRPRLPIRVSGQCASCPRRCSERPRSAAGDGSCPRRTPRCDPTASRAAEPGLHGLRRFTRSRDPVRDHRLEPERPVAPGQEHCRGGFGVFFSPGEDALRRRLSVVVLPFENLVAMV